MFKPLAIVPGLRARVNAFELHWQDHAHLASQPCWGAQRRSERNGLLHVWGDVHENASTGGSLRDIVRE